MVVQFDTQASMERMERLPAVFVGYKNLFRYLLFVMIFFAVLYLQVHIQTYMWYYVYV